MGRLTGPSLMCTSAAIAPTQLGHPERNVNKYLTRINLMTATSAYIEFYEVMRKEKLTVRFKNRY